MPASQPLVRHISSPSRPDTPSLGSILTWRGLQDALLLLGVALVGCLLVLPELGLNLLWNGLIPLAPALLVVFPGLWRNICPMASFALLPQRMGLGSPQALPAKTASLLSVLGLAGLLMVVPLRHISLDHDATATAGMLLLAALTAFVSGLLFKGRSAWCNALCPIHPAERLYGQAPAWTASNARCDHCSKCSRPCPDSTRTMNPTVTGASRAERLAGQVMTGGFAGFVWGWHQVGDLTAPVSACAIIQAYAWPFAGGALSLLLYLTLCHGAMTSTTARRQLVKVFAWAAVTLYYWYRLPALMGFGAHPGTGMLVDWTGRGEWLAWSVQVGSTLFLTWFMLLRKSSPGSWLHRPAEQASASTI